MSGLLAIDHIQLAIPIGAEAAARPFYAGLLGLTEVEKPEPGRSRGGSWYEAGSVKVHLGVEADFRANRKAHPAFVVDDLAGLSLRAETAGFEVAPDHELEGVERAFIFDPFGNRLEFVQAREHSLISDSVLDLGSAEDEPMVLAWELADRLDRRAKTSGDDDGYGRGLRAISELIFKVSTNHPGQGEAMAGQLRAMADYVTENLK